MTLDSIKKSQWMELIFCAFHQMMVMSGAAGFLINSRSLLFAMRLVFRFRVETLCGWAAHGEQAVTQTSPSFDLEGWKICSLNLARELKQTRGIEVSRRSLISHMKDLETCSLQKREQEWGTKRATSVLKTGAASTPVSGMALIYIVTACVQ